MNLFFGGSLGSLMKPHFSKKIGLKNIVRNCLKQNIFWSAARAQALQHELVQRTMGQFADHNYEEADGLFTRPTLDLYYVNKYWNFLTSDLSKEEVADLENARKNLEAYEKLYSLMEYGSDLNETLTTMAARVASANPSVPLTIYRKSTHNDQDHIFDELEILLKAYYNLIDDCAEYPEWQRKIEEDIGQNVSMMVIAFDESDRDDLIARSDIFKRFDYEKQKFFK